MMDSFDLSIQRESAIVITNMIITAKDKDIIYRMLVYDEFKIFKILVSLLNSKDDILLKELLSSLNVILKLDFQFHEELEMQFQYNFQINGGLEHLEKLQSSTKKNI